MRVGRGGGGKRTGERCAVKRGNRGRWVARHEEARQGRKQEAGHAWKQMMLEMIIEPPRCDQPYLPERRDNGAALVQNVFVLNRIMFGNIAAITDREEDGGERNDPIDQDQLPKSEGARCSNQSSERQQ